MNQTYNIRRYAKHTKVQNKQLFTHKYSEGEYDEKKQIHHHVLNTIEIEFNRICHKFVQQMIRINVENLKNTLDHYYCTKTVRVIPYYDKLFISAFKNLKEKLRNIEDTDLFNGTKVKIKKNMVFLKAEFMAQRNYIKEEYKNNYNIKR